MSGDGRRQFEILRCLGAGGFGEVYQAVMTSPGGLETTVALKVLRSDIDVTDDAMRRLRDEGKALGRLDHPAIVRAYDLTVLDARIALVTEYVDGQDLDTCLAADDPLGVRALLQVVAQVADALDAAWQAQGPQGRLYMVHRDIKPSNIRIGRHGQVKLLDFGIARFEGAREAETASDVVLGSLPYMAPERFVDRRNRSASDVFSLGCCLFEGLAGEAFYPDARLTKLSVLAMDDELHEEHLQQRLATLQVPPPLMDLARSCLAFDPEQRPTANELSQQCEALADDAAGSSLRRWCADRSWVDPRETRGSLEGRSFEEGPLEARASAPKPDSDRLPPRMMREAHQTLDPSQDAMVEPPRENKPMAGRRVDTPVAPPAFPSIPLGMAVKKGDQISFKELEEEVGADAAKELAGLPTEEAAPAPVHAPPPLPPAEAPASNTRLYLLLGVAAGGLMLLFLLGLLVIMLGAVALTL